MDGGIPTRRGVRLANAQAADEAASPCATDSAAGRFIARASGVAGAIGVASLGLAYVVTQAGSPLETSEPSAFEASSTAVRPVEVFQVMSPENVPDHTRGIEVSVTPAEPAPLPPQPAPAKPDSATSNVETLAQGGSQAKRPKHGGDNGSRKSPAPRDRSGENKRGDRDGRGGGSADNAWWEALGAEWDGVYWVDWGDVYWERTAQDQAGQQDKPGKHDKSGKLEERDKRGSDNRESLQWREPSQD